VIAIALFVAERFFFVGVVLALAALGSQIAAPLLRHLLFVLRSPRLGEKRPRALAASAFASAALLGGILLLPLPLSTRAQGVVWPPEGTHVRAGANGFVEELLVTPGDSVVAGQPLLRTRDAAIEADLAVREARVRELRARHRAARGSDPIRSQNLSDELAAAEAGWRRARERAGAGLVRSPAGGRFVAPRARDLVGRFVEQGELLGYVVGPSITTARVVIPQESASLVQQQTRGVELRHSRRPGRVVAARVLREVPAATDRLPSAALGSTGGGPFGVDPSDSRGLRTTQSVFQLEIELPRSAGVAEIGGRVHVRFDHGAEPVARRGYRAVRRVLLSRLGV
jgi:putative peptide zinc metalloprotease protein